MVDLIGRREFVFLFFCCCYSASVDSVLSSLLYLLLLCYWCCGCFRRVRVVFIDNVDSTLIHHSFNCSVFPVVSVVCIVVSVFFCLIAVDS